ncbi:TetR/AcrR family transcriptional regulator [Marinitenerispora sediminis]|uniref:TetR/AcrR family transcriptional regulator n=1 Tax=Marinitenerispora sediminis TaxID=1931232 RepID=A0A368T1W3_9ACTN|nr:TetR/AcrR family transcriptional regulator [Marinitenerispora sediminis]RCV49239.1 TetR/AcrR family transcriptional regulator [Marinitenerispora sediminis]RCV49654.1 TetR/AcrR family transcriptional regulator [Marinitenerispora sediminis]RCV54351.1 TetR/AcrR family transcriptional regulator [Marinitenerispora sediminis]
MPTRQETTAVRRQERGRRRMAEILDAAEEVIAEVGFEDATTNAIAARAGISPGSLYQFFRNKDEILAALVPRYTERSHAFWDAQLAAGAARLPLEELLDRVVAAMAAFKAERPAFWVLFHGSATSEQLAGVAKELHEGIADRLCALFAVRAPDLPEERRRMLAQVAISAVNGMFPLVMAAPPEERPAVLAELRDLLRGYLAPHLGLGPVQR